MTTDTQSAAIGRRIVVAAGAWASVGAVFGLFVAYLTVITNESLIGSGASLRFALFVSVTYAGICLLLGGIVASGGALNQRRRRSRTLNPADASPPIAPWFTAHLIAALAALLVVTVGGMLARKPHLRRYPASATATTAMAGFAAAAAVASRATKRLRVRRCWSSVLALFAIAVTLVLVLLSLDRPPMRPDRVALPRRSASAARLMLLGLDGADWRRIRPLVARGRLPTFATLMRDGVTAPLHTMRPTNSPILWSTIITGTTASQHGVYDFNETPLPGLPCGVQRLHVARFLPLLGGMRALMRGLHDAGVLALFPVTSCHRRAKALWNILSDQGERVAVINWWATWPSESVNGYLVSDNNPWRAARIALIFDHVNPAIQGVTYPEGLMAELAAVAPMPTQRSNDEILATPFFADLNAADRLALTRAATLKYLDTTRAVDAFSAASSFYLADKERFALLTAYLPGIDNSSHYAGHQPAVIDHYYEFVDGLLAGFLQRMDANTTLVIVSDHGWDYGRRRSFGHESGPDGILLLYGAGVRRGVELSQTPSLLDITPTLLALLGLPASDEMPGRVIEEALQPDVLAAVPRTPLASYGAYTPPARIPSRNDELTSETMEKLRALGYVR
ncbi:MAG: alkaline phosphatase family protein [Deltaproteobacteria bacterium]|nr:alkaline phosphatase family protein [Deltaproteobacteria bacterium]MBI3389144.1 alkaline phosphatase family protein [Deltaproteobacteria bacterium]